MYTMPMGPVAVLAVWRTSSAWPALSLGAHRRRPGKATVVGDQDQERVTREASIVVQDFLTEPLILILSSAKLPGRLETLWQQKRLCSARRSDGTSVIRDDFAKDGISVDRYFKRMYVKSML